MKMLRGCAILALYASLILGRSCCFRLSGVTLKALPSSGVYRNNDILRASTGEAVISNERNASESQYNWNNQAAASDATVEGNNEVGSLQERPVGFDTANREGTNNYERFPWDSEEARTAMYIIFRCFESAKDQPEDDLYDLVHRWISSLVHDSFFNIAVYRDADGNMPLLFHANFNSFKAYDFVRSQIYSRDPSARDIMSTFYCHISRYSPSSEYYNMHMGNPGRRNALQQVLRFLRRNRYRPPMNPGMQNYPGHNGYGRSLSMQFPSPVPNPEHMFHPTPVPGIHIHPMMHPQPYMGSPGHAIQPPHVSNPMG